MLPKANARDADPINNNDAVRQMITQCKLKEDTPETPLNLRLALGTCECMYETMSKWASTGNPTRPPRLMGHIQTSLGAWEFVLKLHQIVQGYIEVCPAAAARDEIAASKYNVNDQIDRIQEAVSLHRMQENGQ